MSNDVDASRWIPEDTFETSISYILHTNQHSHLLLYILYKYNLHMRNYDYVPASSAAAAAAAAAA